MRPRGAARAWRCGLAACLALAPLASGCAARFLRAGALVELEPGQGILVVRTGTPEPISLLEVRGQRRLANVPAGTSLRLYVMPAGTYRWGRVAVRHWIGELLYESGFQMNDDAYWEFRVEPGALSYPGDLLIERDGSGRRFGARVVNRSALAMPWLEQSHAGLLARYPLRYTGFGRDDFYDEYAKLRRRAQEPPDAP